MRRLWVASRSFRLGLAAFVSVIFWYFFGWQVAVSLLCLAWLLEPQITRQKSVRPMPGTTIRVSSHLRDQIEFQYSPCTHCGVWSLSDEVIDEPDLGAAFCLECSAAGWTARGLL